MVAETSVDVVQVMLELEDSTAIPTKRNKENLKRKIPHDGFEEPEKPVNSVSHSSLNIKKTHVNMMTTGVRLSSC